MKIFSIVCEDMNAVHYFIVRQDGYYEGKLAVFLEGKNRLEAVNFRDEIGNYE